MEIATPERGQVFILRSSRSNQASDEAGRKRMRRSLFSHDVPGITLKEREFFYEISEKVQNPLIARIIKRLHRLEMQRKQIICVIIF